MNKVLTVTVALLLALSGMHLTLSSHYCGGKLHASTVSFHGKTTSCSMDAERIPDHEATFSLHCCDDETAVYSVDNIYSPSDFNVNHSVLNQATLILPWHVMNQDLLNIQPFSAKNPPGYFSEAETDPADICVFRI